MDQSSTCAWHIRRQHRSVTQRPNYILKASADRDYLRFLGDMLARWSNDTFISNVHRVLNVTGQERYSIPFFFGPNYDTVLHPLKTCVSQDRAAKYEPVVAGDYVFQRLARSRLSKEELESKSLPGTAAAA